MNEVIFEEGFKMDNISCVDCNKISYFTFITTKFKLKDSKITNMDLYDNFASLNKDSSYPTVFSLLIVNKEGSGDMLQPSISIEETEVSNI
jgi:hypothetical protein